MIDPDEPPFVVESREGEFYVVDTDGRTVVKCVTAANSEHYAVLLTEAYRRGYKAAVRNSRST